MVGFTRCGYGRTEQLYTNFLVYWSMPCEYVEFSISPPIREDIKKVPDDIELAENKETLRVIIGDQRVKEIKNSEHFNKRVADSEKKLGIDEHPTYDEKKNEKARHYLNVLKAEIGDYATQIAKTFINKLNFELDRATYAVQIERLAYLKFTAYTRVRAGAYVKSDLKIDIFEIVDKDNLLNRMTNSYVNGMKAQDNGDLPSAYKCFYLVYPDKPTITGNPNDDLDLKILRDAASHIELANKNLMNRARDLLGKDYVKTRTDVKTGTQQTYAYADMNVPEHVELYKKYTPILRKHAKDHIVSYIQSKGPHI